MASEAFEHAPNLEVFMTNRSEAVRLPKEDLRVRFGPFTLDAGQRRLVKDGADVPLTPKAFDVLALLIERRPSALGKQDILDAVWQSTFVTENSLATAVRDLRLG